MTPSTRHWHQCETLAGESLRYPPPSADVAGYLRRMRRAAYDPDVGEDALVELESELNVDAFGVTGRFVVAEEIRDPAEAARRWKLFQPT